MLINGTLAWSNLHKHKQAVFNTSDVMEYVELTSDFNKQDTWKPQEEIMGEISVRYGTNIVSETDKSKDAYVRIRLTDLLTIGNTRIIYSDERLMINSDGNYITFKTEEEAKAFLDQKSSNDYSRIKFYTSYLNDKPLYYIASTQDDDNGQYGKFLPKEFISEYNNSQTEGFDLNVTSDSVETKDYVSHKWNTSNTNPMQDLINNYIKINLNTNNVMTYDDWLNTNQEVGDYWILDTRGEEGWVYWPKQWNTQ